jgi:hypothetical protein
MLLRSYASAAEQSVTQLVFRRGGVETTPPPSVEFGFGIILNPDIMCGVNSPQLTPIRCTSLVRNAKKASFLRNSLSENVPDTVILGKIQ